MERTKVESSQIHSIGYDAETRILEVAFRVRSDPAHVNVYRYADVPPETHAEFMAADSKGKYLNAVIKSGWRDRFTKVGLVPIEDAPSLPGDDTASTGEAPTDVVQSDTSDKE